MKILDKNLELENNKFKVINFDTNTYEKSNRKRLYYVIKCKQCNQLFSRRKEALKNINTIKCSNCIHNRFGKCLNTILYNIYIHYIHNAKVRNITWNLTEEEFKKIITKKCVYCGELHKHSENLYYTGIDRIDSKTGYYINNCVSCCKICNIMKNKFSKDQFLNKVEQIYNNLIKSSTTISKESTLQADGNGNGELLTTVKAKEEDIV